MMLVIFLALFGISLARVIAVGIAERSWDGEGFMYVLCTGALLAAWVTL